eukprot:jgi/Tetstr1/436486/TSEL_025314.t1
MSLPHLCDVLQLGQLRRREESGESGGLVQCEARRRSGEQLERRVRALAAGLAATQPGAALAPGEAALLLAPNSDSFLEALLAASATGALVAPLNTRWSAVESVASARAAEALIAEHADEPAVPWRHSPCGGALACFTSGTSGASKAVLLGARALLGQAAAKQQLVGYDPSDTFLHAAPLFHIGGLSYALAALAAGASHLLLPRFTADNALAAMRDNGITATIMLPALLHQLLGQGGESFPAIRSIVIGAGRPTPAQLARCREAFPNATFHSAYGMTEVGSTITWRTLWGPNQEPVELHALEEGAHPSALSCVGRPIHSTQVRVMATPEREAGSGEEGEVWVRGAHVMLRYIGRAEESAAALTPAGWLITGDVGCTDHQGRLWLLGRKKDVIKSGGENVHAAEVEAALGSHPGVAAAAVVGLPHEALGETVGALLQMAPGWEWGAPGMEAGAGAGRPLSLADLQAHCAAAGLSRYKLPRTAHGSPDPLPANGAGKVLKHEARTRLAAVLAGSRPASRM